MAYYSRADQIRESAYRGLRCARAPLSSRHPKTKEIFANKPTLLVLNKSDLADKKLLLASIKMFSQSADEKALSLSLKSKANKQDVLHLIQSLTEEKRKALIKKGINVPITRNLCNWHAQCGQIKPYQLAQRSQTSESGR